MSTSGPELSPSAESAALDESDAVIRAYLHSVDASLLRKNLTLTVEERFRQLMQLQAFALELRRAGARAQPR